MRLFIIIILACVWIALAVNAYSRGQTGMAGAFLAIGAVLTIVRLRR